MNIGIDFGSRSVKIAVLEEDGSLKEKFIYDSITFYNLYRNVSDKNSLSLDFNKLGFSDNDKIIATGYGKYAFRIKNVQTISEQKAHMLGAIHQTGLKDFVLLDIGGQDTKILKVAKGKMTDVYMNDKCGASSGRYIENMARVLSLTLDDISKYSKQPQHLNNTCAVFGESEVLGKVFEGVNVENIAAGVNYSVFERVFSVLAKMVEKEKIVFVGGVSKNKAIAEFIRAEFDVEVIIPKHEQLNGAIGAAVFK